MIGQVFAMKSMLKEHMIVKNQETHVKAERDVMAEADDPWIVKLMYSFQVHACCVVLVLYVFRIGCCELYNSCAHSERCRTQRSDSEARFAHSVGSARSQEQSTTSIISRTSVFECRPCRAVPKVKTRHPAQPRNLFPGRCT